MRFSKEKQPQRRRKPSGNAKVTLSVRVKPKTKEYYNTHKGEAARVLEENIKEEE